MDIEIKENLSINLYGFAGTVLNNNFKDTGFGLMNKMWERIRANNLKHKGLNTWIYEGNTKLFAGVELDDVPPAQVGLEFKNVELTKYVYYKHIGSYGQIGKQGDRVVAELKERGIPTTTLYIEIYGHWANDETKLETELIWAIK